MVHRTGVRLAVALAIPLLSSCVLLAGFADDQNLLTNGSFEDGTFNPPANGVISLPLGSKAMPGWTVIGKLGNNVAWLQNVNDYVPNAATDGTHFVDLTGNPDTAVAGQFGGLAQPFQTLPGVLYEVSLDIGVSKSPFGGPISVKVEISNTSNGEKYYEATCGPFNNPEAQGPQWMMPKCTFRFHAASDNTTLTIYGALGTYYIGVDNVTAECVAPLGRHAWCGTVKY